MRALPYLRLVFVSASAILLVFGLVPAAFAAEDDPASAAALQVDNAYSSLSEVAATQELFDVCVSNNLGKNIQAAIAEGANVHGTLGGGETPLMVCTGSSRESDVEALLAAGADPNAQSVDGTTALMLAAKTGQIGVIKRLLAAGANASSTDAFGNTPLLVAAMHGQARLSLCCVALEPSRMSQRKTGAPL